MDILYSLLKFRKYLLFFRFLFAFSFVFVVFPPLNAQEGASIGFKFGSGFSRYYFALDPGLNEPINQDFAPVYEAGLVFSHQSGKAAGLQIELQYAQKAWQEKFDDGSKSNVLIHFIELPVLTHMRLPFKSGKSALIINFGFYGAYAFKETVELIGEVSDSTLINYHDFKYNKVDYGLRGGVGFEKKIGRGSVQIQAMYSQGLQDIIGRDRLKVYRSLNQSLFVSAMYKIPLSRNKKGKQKI